MVDSHIFISYSRQDRVFTDRLINDLQAAGLSVWIDKQGLKVGTPDWEQAIREAIRGAYVVLLIATPDSRESRYVRDEIAIADMYERPIIAMWAFGEHWPESIRMGLMGTQYADARGKNYKKALLETVAAINTMTTVASPSTPISTPELDFEPRNPYKGLRAFTGKDKGDFFGRDKLITELIDALKNNTDTNRFLAIVGPSGSGKSSVVMAGLLPRLQENALPGSKNWVYLDPVLPGSQPLESLAVILADALKISTTDVIKDLDASSRGLHLLSRRLVKERDSRLVLLVDQFEELFTQTTDNDQRSHFIDLLITAATEPAGQIIVLITLRADFYDRPMNYPEFAKLLEKRAKYIIPMDVNDLREVIEKPAALPDVQLQFEPGLVGDLVFEVRSEIGALPLLQFTLDQLVEKRKDRSLTNTAYKELGGVKGALARHAETTYQQLTSDKHRELARTLFLRLIEPGATEQDTTRRRASQRELILSDNQKAEALFEVREVFINSRLLTTIQETSGKSTIEVSHEALIREWERLSYWVRTAYNDVRLQQLISRDATDWITHIKRDDDLYRGAKLTEALDWSLRNAPSIEEQDFLDASVKLSERLKTDEIFVEQLQSANEQLRELDRLRSDYLANMSHELRTPLNSIIGFSRVMLKGIDGPLTEMQEQDLSTIYTSGVHLVGLINDILDQAKIEKGLMQLKLDYFDLKSVVEIVRSITIGLVKDKPIDIHVIAESNLPKAYGDETRTRQILLNLSSNAAKFTTEGSIFFRAHKQIDTETGAIILRVDVQDTGIGIAENDIPFLYEAFRQKESSLTRTVGGTGLGLPISKSLTEMQGGRLFVSSEIGVGSTFSITIPTEPPTT